MAVSGATMALEVDKVLARDVLSAARTLPTASMHLPAAVATPPSITAVAPTLDMPETAVIEAESALVEQALGCSVRQAVLALPLGALSPGSRSEDHRQAQAFQVACPMPASYRLLIVNADGDELVDGIVPVRIGEQGRGQLRITIDGQAPGADIRHNGVLPKTHQLAVELRDDLGRARVPSASGVFAMLGDGVSLVLRPSRAEAH